MADPKVTQTLEVTAGGLLHGSGCNVYACPERAVATLRVGGGEEAYCSTTLLRFCRAHLLRLRAEVLARVVEMDPPRSTP